MALYFYIYNIYFYIHCMFSCLTKRSSNQPLMFILTFLIHLHNPLSVVGGFTLIYNCHIHVPCCIAPPHSLLNKKEWMTKTVVFVLWYYFWGFCVKHHPKKVILRWRFSWKVRCSCCSGFLVSARGMYPSQRPLRKSDGSMWVLPLDGRDRTRFTKETELAN